MKLYASANYIAYSRIVFAWKRCFIIKKKTNYKYKYIYIVYSKLLCTYNISAIRCIVKAIKALHAKSRMQHTDA